MQRVIGSKQRIRLGACNLSSLPPLLDSRFSASTRNNLDMRQIIRRFQTRQTKRAPKKDTMELGSKLPDLNFREYGEFSLGRLPTEILLDIMETILSEDSRPGTRTTLRLVSRSRCSLFGPDGYPTLWTCASIPIPGKIEQMDACIEYCHNFTLYSGTNQLDIVLDYRRISAQTPRSFFLAFDDRTRLTSRIEQLEPTLEVPIYANPIISPLLLLCGPAGKLMQRWHSLTIHSVKADELYEAFIFPYILFAAPKLTSMAFQRSGSLPKPKMGGVEMALTLNCPNLYRLRLRTIAWNLSAQGSIPSSLRHLELSHCSEQTFAFALLCQNLETLSLEYAPFAGLRRYPTSKLPRLRRLSVLGRMISFHPIWIKISFPALEHVRLWCTNILSDIDDLSYNLNQLSNILFHDGTLSPRFPKLREVFLDLPKPHESRLLDIADPAIDKTHFVSETLIYLTRIKALATTAEVESREYHGSGGAV